MKNIDTSMHELVEYTRLQEETNAIFDYFKFHSKNLTKKQEWKLQELQDLIHEMGSFYNEH